MSNPSELDGIRKEFNACLREFSGVCKTVNAHDKYVQHDETYAKLSATVSAKIEQLTRKLGAAHKVQQPSTFTTNTIYEYNTECLAEVLSSANKHIQLLSNAHLTASQVNNTGKSQKSSTTSNSGKGSSSSGKAVASHSDPQRNDYTPWKPLLRSKPNAIAPLPDCILDDNAPPPPEGYPHPYQPELKQLVCNVDMWTHTPKTLPLSNDSCPFMFVQTVEDLKIVEQELLDAKEIAIDVEHHSLHSYLGKTCLLQISTRTKDYVICTLALWDDLHILNSSFTNPKILKVLHGSNCDIIWLQRDLGLYIVNMFDTAVAAHLAGLQKYGLAFLLETYCDVRANKRYQMADWSLRPLSRSMLDYARSDTHYLLYVKDRLVDLLIDHSHNLLRQTPNLLTIEYKEIRNVQVDCNSKYRAKEDIPFLLLSVFARSKDITLTTFEKVVDLEEGGLAFAVKAKLSGLSKHVCKGLWVWREKICRPIDESTGYLLSNQKVIAVSRAAPKTMDELRTVLGFHCNNLLSTHLGSLLACVKKLVKEYNTAPPTPAEDGKGKVKSPTTVTAAVTSTTTTDMSDSTSRTSPGATTGTEEDGVDIYTSVGWTAQANVQVQDVLSTYKDSYTMVSSGDVGAKLDRVGILKSKPTTVDTTKITSHAGGAKEVVYAHEERKMIQEPLPEEVQKQLGSLQITSANALDWDNETVATPQIGTIPSLMSPDKKSAPEEITSLQDAYKLSNQMKKRKI